MDKIKIQTEGTPNPNALKFVLDKVLLEKGTYNYPDKESSKDSPLAKRIFNVTSVKEVFIGKDFVTISKNPETNWDTIYDKLVESINQHFDSGEPVVNKTSDSKNTAPTSENEVEKRIHEILDSQIRPAVAGDGGDVIFNSYKDGVLKLHLQGACSTCPSSIMTLKVGIESMLKKQIPELKEVISV